MKYLMTHFDLSNATMIGASAGGLASTLTACGVNPDRAVRWARCTTLPCPPLPARSARATALGALGMLSMCS